MKFRDWLKIQETGTSTACVAGFARMALPHVRRGGDISGLSGHDSFFDKKKKKKKKKD